MWFLIIITNNHFKSYWHIAQIKLLPIFCRLSVLTKTWSNNQQLETGSPLLIWKAHGWMEDVACALCGWFTKNNCMNWQGIFLWPIYISQTKEKCPVYSYIYIQYIWIDWAFFFWQRLFALSANSYRFYLHSVKKAGFSAIYTAYCK